MAVKQNEKMKLSILVLLIDLNIPRQKKKEKKLLGEIVAKNKYGFYFVEGPVYKVSKVGK